MRKPAVIELLLAVFALLAVPIAAASGKGG